jgi:hypothetical protein
LTFTATDGLEQVSHDVIVKIKLETAIDNLVEENIFSCYPNPLETGNLNIQLKTNKGLGSQVHVEMYDISGKLLNQVSYPFSGTGFNKRLPVHTVPSGLFILKVKSGKYVFSEIMLKK